MPICALWSTLNAKAVLSFPCGSWVRFLIGVKMLVLAAKDEIGNLHEGSKELKWSWGRHPGVPQDCECLVYFRSTVPASLMSWGVGTLQLFLIEDFLHHWFFHVNRLDAHFNKSWFADWGRYCENPSELQKTALTLSKAPCPFIVLKIRKPMTKLELWDDSN